MKQKQLIKRGLAAVLSATMALTLAPNVGLLSVPAFVKASAALSTVEATAEGTAGFEYDGDSHVVATYNVAEGERLYLAVVDSNFATIDDIEAGTITSVDEKAEILALESHVPGVVVPGGQVTGEGEIELTDADDEYNVVYFIEGDGIDSANKVDIGDVAQATLDDDMLELVPNQTLLYGHTDDAQLRFANEKLSLGDDVDVNDSAGVVTISYFDGANYTAPAVGTTARNKIIVGKHTAKVTLAGARNFADVADKKVSGTFTVKSGFEGNVAIDKALPVYGDKITASVTDVGSSNISDDATVSYKWYRLAGDATTFDPTTDELIAGATTKSYTVGKADIGKKLVVAVNVEGFEFNNTQGNSRFMTAAVDKKELTIDKITVEDKTYDGVAEAKVKIAIASGGIGSDTFDNVTAIAVLDSANAGDNVGVADAGTLKAGSVNLGSVDYNKCYTLPAGWVAATSLSAKTVKISKKDLTVSVGDLKLYHKATKDVEGNYEPATEESIVVHGRPAIDGFVTTANGTEGLEGVSGLGVDDGFTITEISPKTNANVSEEPYSVEITYTLTEANGTPAGGYTNDDCIATNLATNYTIGGEAIAPGMKLAGVPLVITDKEIPEIGSLALEDAKGFDTTELFAYDAEDNSIAITAIMIGDNLTIETGKIEWATDDEDGCVSLSEEPVYNLNYNGTELTCTTTVTLNKYCEDEEIVVTATSKEDNKWTASYTITTDVMEIEPDVMLVGNANVGDTLTAAVVVEAGEPDCLFNWYVVDGKDEELITDMTETENDEYVIKETDLGKKIKVELLDNADAGYTLAEGEYYDVSEVIGEAVVTTYTVSFSDGVEAQTVEAGATATKPADPTKEGYNFLGWFEDGSETAFDFSTPITKDITLIAKWEEKKSEGEGNTPEGEGNTPEGNTPAPAPTPSTDTTTGSSTDVTPSSGGSGGSGGGGGSANTTTTTTKNADGSTTTKSVTKTATGTTTVTTTKNTDGSETKTKVVENKDGSGAVTETTKTAKGTVKEVAVITDTTGAATEVTTSVTSASGASMKVSYTAKGSALTVSKIETTNKKAVTIPATVKVGGKTYKVTAVGKNALKGNKDVTTITFGKNIKTIGAKACYGATKAKTLTFKKAPTKVGTKAFTNINKNATIKITGTAKAYKKAVKLIKKAGAPKTVKYKRVK